MAIYVVPETPNQKQQFMPSLLGFYTLAHVAISLAALLVGVPAISEMLRGAFRSTSMFWFSSLTALTCLTGFGFPASVVTPAHVLGGITLTLLAIAYFARSRSAASGRWKRVFFLTVIASQYLNFFVFIVQAFQKITFLQSLAPTQSELPFVVAQILGVALFVHPVWRSFTTSTSINIEQQAELESRP